jgi:hypothetical protein
MEMKISIMSFTAVCIASSLGSVSLLAAEPRDLNVTNALIIEQIVCEGNETSDCDFITKKFYQKSGDLLDPSKVSDAKLRLGSMVQFRNVDVQLKKGSERGQVIVVFEVLEANQIQYALSFGKHRSSHDSEQSACTNNAECSYNSLENTSDSNGFNISRTDFNFLGKGEILTSGASINYSTLNFAQMYDNSERIDSSRPSYSNHGDSKSKALSLYLSYHDEHFLGTPDYELSANVSSFFAKSASNIQTIYFDSDAVEQEQVESSYKSVNSNFSVSKRFARYSSVGVSSGVELYNSYHASSLELDAVSFYYSFNTLNDTLFATRGDRFNTGISFSDSLKALYLNYGNVYAISDDTVIDFGISGAHNMSNSLNSNSFNTSISLKINQGSNYLYSGWALGLSAGANDNSDQWETNKSLFASYIHQTESMTYSFSLGYSK